MKTLYTGWAGMHLTPNLSIEAADGHPQRDWLFAKRPGGQWVTLAKIITLAQNEALERAAAAVVVRFTYLEECDAIAELIKSLKEPT